MPSKKINFSLAPINDNPTNVSGGNIVDGYSHKAGFPTLKFSIPAQDVLLDVSTLKLSGQMIVNDIDGSTINLGIADELKWNVNNESATIQRQNCINTSNWNGVASVIDKVIVQSKKTQTELSTITNYSGYNALKMGQQNNQDDYLQSPLIHNLCSGSTHGLTCRHLINTTQIGESRSSSYSDKFMGQFFSIPIDIALLQAQSIHLGNGYAGGLLITIHLSPDSAVFHQRFRSVNVATAGGSISGVSYILKNVKLEGKYAVPTSQDLQSYNPVITMNSRVNLMNDVVSSENANTYTPQLRMVKGIVNTFLDDNQSNNYTLNQNNFRVPCGLVQYQQAKNNIRYPNDYETKLVPNAQSLTTAGVAVVANQTTFPVSIQGDSELRLQFGRALLGGRLASHTSSTLDLTNECLKDDYNADVANTNLLQTGGNTHPDLLGIAVDYSNNIGQVQGYVNQDYELKISSGVNTGRVNLPQTRSTRIAIQESYVKNNSQIDLRTLQKVQ
tara:strand:+ start:2050 stop:3552 length:1503 start_codon:yes stop_codon:yes gene_type:complete